MKRDPIYNAALGVPAGWLTLEDSKRVELVLASHAHLGTGHPRTSNVRVHSAMHVVVENQLAAGDPMEARPTRARLVDEGLDRHQAVHAMGQVVAELTFSVLKREAGASENVAARLAAGYLAMTAEKFLAGLDEEG